MESIKDIISKNFTVGHGNDGGNTNGGDGGGNNGGENGGNGGGDGASESWFRPNWNLPPNVRALITTRAGGFSSKPYESFNLGLHVGDNPMDVLKNRKKLEDHIGRKVGWLQQVHGVNCARADLAVEAIMRLESPSVEKLFEGDWEKDPQTRKWTLGLEADACFDRLGKDACGVLTADCLPVLLCDRKGSWVAAAHAGWRGLARGVVQSALATYDGDPGDIMAYLGPTIGPEAFEVGKDVLEAFLDTGIDEQKVKSCFNWVEPMGKYLMDMYSLAKVILNTNDVFDVTWDPDACTIIERDKYFSYRREKDTGRMGSVIWIDKAGVEA